MQKGELVKRIAHKTGMKIKDVDMAIEGFMSVMVDSFNADERVELRGFGNFIKKTRKARKGRNINNGEIINVPAKDVYVFKQSTLFGK